MIGRGGCPFPSNWSYVYLVSILYILLFVSPAVFNYLCLIAFILIQGMLSMETFNFPTVLKVATCLPPHLDTELEST